MQNIRTETNATDKFVYTFLGMVLGLAAGVATGVLFAPKSGDESRRLLREKALESKEKMQQSITRQKDEIENKINQVKSKANEATDESIKTVKRIQNNS